MPAKAPAKKKPWYWKPYKLGELIRKRRESLFIGRWRASRLCGMYAKSLDRLEKGETEPTMDTIQKVADGLRLVISFAPEGEIVVHELPFVERKHYLKWKTRKKNVKSVVQGDQP